MRCIQYFKRKICIGLSLDTTPSPVIRVMHDQNWVNAASNRLWHSALESNVRFFGSSTREGDRAKARSWRVANNRGRGETDQSSISPVGRPSIVWRFFRRQYASTPSGPIRS